MWTREHHGTQGSKKVRALTLTMIQDEEQPGCQELVKAQICANLSLYAEKYDEEFEVGFAGLCCPPPRASVRRGEACVVSPCHLPIFLLHSPFLANLSSSRGTFLQTRRWPFATTWYTTAPRLLSRCCPRARSFPLSSRCRPWPLPPPHLPPACEQRHEVSDICC